MANAVLYHNPRCSKSRQTLQLLRNHGIEPTIIEYLKTPLTKSTLTTILHLLAISPRDLMRKGESAYKENNLSDPTLSNNALIQAMVQNPILIERPIVVIDEKKAALGRPPENVLEIL